MRQFRGVEVRGQPPRVVKISRELGEGQDPHSPQRSLPPLLGRLPWLHDLRLPRSRLTGSIPPELGQLSRLVFLELSHNQLSGPLPPELGRLPRLAGLYLADNQLSDLSPPSWHN